MKLINTYTPMTNNNPISRIPTEPGALNDENESAIIKAPKQKAKT